MEESNEIYLFTVKNPKEQETLQKKAFANIHKALAEFQNYCRSKMAQGYGCSDQSYVTEAQYIKTAKLTYRGITIRLRLENIPLESE